MKTSNKPPTKILAQKGQGLLEYALILAFVAALAMFVFKGGLGDAIKGSFDSASDTLASTNTLESDDDSSGEETSFDYETLTAEDIAPTYKTLNWREIDLGVQSMYNTVLKSDTADKALVSETNLFGQISAMVENHLASTNAADGTKDWEAFIATVERMQKNNNVQSRYKRGEETIAIQRLGNSNSVQIRWSDGKEVVYYRLSPDANNVMQIETNSNLSYSQFFSPIVNSGGWEYDK